MNKPTRGASVTYRGKRYRVIFNAANKPQAVQSVFERSGTKMARTIWSKADGAVDKTSLAAVVIEKARAKARR